METIKRLVDETKLVSHQIRHYDDFIYRRLQSVVDREECITVSSSTELRVQQIWVEPPRTVNPDRSVKPTLPNDARLRSISYEGTCFVNASLHEKTTDRTLKLLSRIPIGKIPIMVKSHLCNSKTVLSKTSGECPNDAGGYFIIKGKERVLVAQLRQAYNRLFIRQGDDVKFPYIAEFRSVSENGSANSVLLQAKIDVNDDVFFSIPYVKSLIPAGTIFRALGVDDIREYCTVDSCVRQFTAIKTAEEAFRFVESKLSSDGHLDARTILCHETFHHFFQTSSNKIVAYHLAYVLRHLYAAKLKRRTCDDKHNLANKRLDGTGNLMEFIFQSLYKHFTKTVQAQIRTRKNPDIVNVMKSITIISNGFNTCFMTGTWTPQKNPPASAFVRIGVSQVLSCQNYSARTSHLRRIAIPMGTKGKNSSARHLHPSEFSYVCPYETPEGETVGIVKNLALTCDITTSIPSVHVLECLRRIGAYDMHGQLGRRPGCVLVLLNGMIVGSSSDPVRLLGDFNVYRQSDEMHGWHVSIVWLRRYSEIHIESDEGRFIRPLFNLSKSIVWRCPSELEEGIVAMTESDMQDFACNYLEICPAATMMGVIAATVPLANHSQSPRIAYQSNMGKQAIGLPFMSFMNRYDTSVNVLDYGQMPISRNAVVPIVKYDQMCHGAMPVVAIMTYTGFNQEDSVILNKASLDRGLFHAHTYKTIVEEERKHGSADNETICLPKAEHRRREYNYDYIDEETGIINYRPQLMLVAGDVVVGKTTTRNAKKKSTTSDSSLSIKTEDEGYLDSVVVTESNDGTKLVKVRIRIPRRVNIGDKFASSTAQKGTCGMILAQEDMPFDKDGICPDMIINPHAIPSRMTINMLIEMSLNLVGCVDGRLPDATTFAHDNVEQELSDYLDRLGWESYSSQMYSGFTGEKLKSRVFMAPCSYQRLKHMVDDKMHVRIAGPLDTLTHQPVAGRSRDGGLRCGEMERDCLLTHGSTRVLKECLFDQSDKYVVGVCTSCGGIAQTDDFCKTCRGKSRVEQKNLPYASKLFIQQLTGMTMKLKLK